MTKNKVISLAEACKIAVKAMTDAEERRQREREMEAQYWKSFEES